jgi:ribosomal protein S18 acetylase RimI-like enzyme
VNDILDYVDYSWGIRTARISSTTLFIPFTKIGFPDMKDIYYQFDEFEATDITCKFIYALYQEIEDPQYGFVLGRLSVQYFTSNKEVLIQDLFVDGPFRRDGVAKQLILKAMEYVSRHVEVKVWSTKIHVTNEPSKALFKSLGFELNSSQHYHNYYTKTV